MEKRITHSGTLELSGVKIPCFVTEDEQRLLASRRIQVLLKITEETTNTGQQVAGSRLDRFLNQKAIKPLFSLHSDRTLFEPVKAKFGNRSITGYDARILPKICNIMLEARREGKLKGTRQLIIAKQCEILLLALDVLGIIGLVDEATKYQYVRREDFLQKLLEKYLSPKRLDWAKKFPDTFYLEIFRLRGWPINGKNRPAIVGKYTNNIIYDRIAPSLVKELEKKNPKDEKGRRQARHHQWLTKNIGHPELEKHLYAVVTLMRTCQTWNRFMAMLERALPKLDKDMEKLPTYFPLPRYEEEEENKKTN